MSKVYVMSTLAASVDYHVYRHAGDSRPVRERTIHVAGGAGVAGKNLITPQGVATEITEEEAKLLEEHGLFQMHRENGYVSISRSQPDPDKAAADMATDDPGKPLTPNDFDESSGDDDVETLTAHSNANPGKKKRGPKPKSKKP